MKKASAWWLQLRQALRRKPSDSEHPASPGTRSWRTQLLTPIAFLLALLCGFGLAFPEQQLLARVRQELYRQTGMQLLARSSEVALPMTLHFSGCRLEPSPLNVPMLLDQISVSPRWGQLLLGQPGVALRVVAWGGELSGNVASDGRFDLELEGFELGEFAALPDNYRLSGRLAGSAYGTLWPQPQLDWQLSFQGLEIAGLQAFGIEEPLPLGNLNARGELMGRNLQLADMRLAGGVLGGGGSGTLLIGQTPASSRISATLQAKPNNGLPPLFKDMLSMSGQQPDAQGQYRFRLNGRLDAPSLR